VSITERHFQSEREFIILLILRVNRVDKSEVTVKYHPAVMPDVIFYRAKTSFKIYFFSEKVIKNVKPIIWLCIKK